MTTAPSTDTRSSALGVVGELPRDLLAILFGVPVVAALLSAPVDFGVLRVLVGFAFVFVVPGYGLVSALYPAAPAGEIGEPADDAPYSPGTAERLALSFGASLALLPVVAVSLGLLGTPFSATSVVGALGVATICFVAVAMARRLALDPARRYRPPSLADRYDALRRWAAAGDGVDTALAVAVACAVALALGAVGYGLAAPAAEQSYTGVSLVTESGGEYVASGYPTNLTAGESADLTLRVHNDRDAAVDVTAIAELQRVDGGDGSVTVLEREPVAELSTTVGANETEYVEHTVEPTIAGEDMRLIYYVYRGDAPAEPSVASADRHVHLWVDVAPA